MTDTTTNASVFDFSDDLLLPPHIAAMFPDLDSDDVIEDDAGVFVLDGENLRDITAHWPAPWNQPQWIDAVTYGPVSAAVDAVMNKPMTLITAKDTGAKFWDQNEWTWASLARGIDTRWGLAQHNAKKKKDSRAVLFVSSGSGERTKDAIRVVHGLALDFDAGVTVEEVHDAVVKSGLTAFLYSSFSHGAEEDTVPRKTLSEVTEKGLREYLRGKGHTEAFVDAVEVLDFEYDAGPKFVVRFSCPPLERARVVLPLEESVAVKDMGATPEDAPDVFAEKVRGLGKMLGLPYDESSEKITQPYYFPAHLEGRDYVSRFIRGSVLNWDDIPCVPKAKAAKANGAKKDFNVTDRDGKSFNTEALRRRYGKRWIATDIFEELAHGDDPENLAIECPNGPHDVGPNDTSTTAIDTLGDGSGFLSISCMHHTCAGMTMGDFLKSAVENGYVTMAMLEDPDRMHYPPDGWEGEEGYHLTPSEKAGDVGSLETSEDVHDYVADNFDKNSRDTDIKAFFDQIRAVGDETMFAWSVDALEKHTSLGKRALNKLRKVEKTASAPDGACVLDQCSFKEQLAYSQNVITMANEENPRVFLSGNRLARVQRDPVSNTAEIVDLSRDDVVVFLTEHGDYRRSSQESTVGVACPDDMGKHIVHKWDKDDYPFINGIISAPQYTESGRLVSTPGYDKESGLYFTPPDDFDVGDIPAKPTSEDVAEAVELLRDAFADFPFEGMTRSQLEAGETSADFANTLGLLLQTPARSMIAGNVPAFLATKPAAGTGATKLLQACQLILYGETDVRPPATQGEGELAKEVLSILLAGKPMVVWDNVTEVGGNVYPALLTAPVFSGRLLQHSVDRSVPNRTAVAFTGNNPTMSKDLRRRIFLCRLNAEVERPEDRPVESFKHFPLDAYVSSNRAPLYRALLILTQNWLAQGSPEPSSAIMASYESWSRVVGGILESAGVSGFLTNREKVDSYTAGEGEEDPYREFVAAWLDAARDPKDPVTREMRASGDNGLVALCRVHEIALDVKLVRQAQSPFNYEPRKFGEWLGRAADKVFEIDGSKLSIKKGARVHGGTKWHLIER